MSFNSPTIVFLQVKFHYLGLIFNTSAVEVLKTKREMQEKNEVGFEKCSKRCKPLLSTKETTVTNKELPKRLR